MPRLRTASHPFDQLIQRAAEIIAERLSGMVIASGGKASTPRSPAANTANARRSTALLGKKLDMGCRVEGCKNRSGGPRWGFICEEHRTTLSKKQQQQAREAWRMKQAA